MMRWQFMLEQIHDAGLLKRGNYEVDCYCRNCGWKGKREFPFGEKVPATMSCDKCRVEDCVRA